MRPVDVHIKDQLTQHLDEIGRSLDADVVAIISPIVPGLEQGLRHAVDMLDCKKSSVAVILDTPGGVVEVVERMVTALRSVYSEVVVIVPGDVCRNDTCTERRSNHDGSSVMSGAD